MESALCAQFRHLAPVTDWYFARPSARPRAPQISLAVRKTKTRIQTAAHII
jgi:hypothetical protein